MKHRWSTTTKLRLSLCPYCGQELNAATNVGSAKIRPSAGDMTVCIACAKVLIFDAAIVPRKPIPGEIEDGYAQNPGLEAALRHVQRAVLLLDAPLTTRQHGGRA